MRAFVLSIVMLYSFAALAETPKAVVKVDAKKTTVKVEPKKSEVKADVKVTKPEVKVVKPPVGKKTEVTITAPAKTERAVAPSTQPASQPVVKKDADPVKQVGTIISLFRSKNWRPAIAALITLLIFFWRRYGNSFIIGKIPSKHLAWVTALIGFVSALPDQLTATNFVWVDFVLNGFITGGQAALFWSTLGKLVLPKVFGSHEPAASEETPAAPTPPAG